MPGFRAVASGGLFLEGLRVGDNVFNLTGGQQRFAPEFLGHLGFDILREKAGEANVLLRSMANENRLMILCLLADGERSVGEIETLTGARQPTVSQQLARLRADGIVESRRDGKAIHNSLCCDRTRRLLEELLRKLYRVAAAAVPSADPD